MVASFEAASRIADKALILNEASAGGMLIRIAGGPRAALAIATRMPDADFWARVVEYLVARANEEQPDTMRPAVEERR